MKEFISRTTRGLIVCTAKKKGNQVYILNWLFTGGLAPKPIACPPSWIPATGQAKCYDDQENQIPCDSADFPGQDGFYQAGCRSQDRFVDNVDGTISDLCTGLMWQKSTGDVDGNGTIDNEDKLNWQSALKYCQNLSLAGHTDWRLPNVRELESIVDYGRIEPAVSDPFLSVPASGYWSSTTDFYHSAPFDPIYALDVTSGGGQISFLDKLEKNFVRAVRNAP